jgi:ABC-type transport system substrate-binding protein
VPSVRGLNRRQTLGFMLGAGALAASPRIVWAQGAKPSLTLATGTEPLTLDAGRVAGGADYLFFGNVFEGLYSHDIDGKLVPNGSAKSSRPTLPIFQLSSASWRSTRASRP